MKTINLPYYYCNIYNKLVEKNVVNNAYNHILICGFNGYIFGELMDINNTLFINYNTIDKDLHKFFFRQFINNSKFTIICNKDQNDYYINIQKYLNI